MHIYSYINTFTESYTSIYFWRASILSFLIFLILAIAEFVIKRKESTLFRILTFSKSCRFDLFFFLLDMLKLFPILISLSYLGIFDIFFSLIKPEESFNLLQKIDSQFIQIILYFLIIDFCGYWIHRSFHEIPILWEIHKVHHTADEMNIITSSRRHPIEEGFKKIILSFPLMIVGVPIEHVFLYSVFLISTRFIHHMNVSWDFGFVGKFLLVSPLFHHIHHSTSPNHYNSNYGIRLIIWDVLFGTAIRNYPTEIKFGINESRSEDISSPVKSIVYSEIKFLKVIKNTILKYFFYVVKKKKVNL